MDQRSIVARIAELVSGTAPGSAGSTSEVIFGVLHGALDGSRKAREISSTLKAHYGVDLRVKEVAEYVRFRGSKAGNSPGGADGAAGGARKTRARIITALLAKVDRMVEEIIQNPSSETTQLVKCLLLTEMTTEDGRSMIWKRSSKKSTGGSNSPRNWKSRRPS